jgi:hypothetical protein
MVMMMKTKTNVGIQVKKLNPVWNEIFKDERLVGEINPELPHFLKMAIEHERRCIKHRLKQVETYLDRITFLEAGMDYFDTFKQIQGLKGIPFPKDEYVKLRTSWEKMQERKSKKAIMLDK